MDPLIIIPARAGSRAIPGKNFKALAGMATPVERAIRCALAVAQPHHIVLTTDYEFKQAAEGDEANWSTKINFRRRPPELATDTALMIDVVLDVLEAFPGPDRQSVLLVQPTQPLRTPQHLQRALNLLHWYPAVASVVETIPAQKCFVEGFVPVGSSQYTERRQDAARTYTCDGTFYGFRRRVFLQHPCFIGPHVRMTPIDPWESCPLDTLLDWHLAELRLRDLRP